MPYIDKSESNFYKKPIISVNSRFSNFSSEFKHLLVGMTLVLLVGISFFVSYSNTTYTAWSVLILGIILMSSFLVHEMAHKFYALKKGYHAEFRLNNMGLFLTFISIFPIPLKIIAPGAVTISGYPPSKILGKIALAGPLSNIFLGLAFVFLYNTFTMSNEWMSIYSTSAYINGFLATFNMLPLGIIDGKKVFNWNKTIWILFFLISILFLLSIP
tara:strand:- start:58 stop:702 length:645 start_codon:yes stop_codon:yes gene_type:complete